ncbi:helix-turn-helix transcriptional regulator [Exilibacterium tricleocarpae]|uniref:Helix-turn-helix transcriptional regulator n=1 Tax=Exilibacterium tricleocarpae TaxID=2591008 RepID=A0A545TLF4_9GAMM|nr:AraC family transcriptional regulator [Exilibacterium tricleocarpae]TQV78053.1 helix-turn-helix transcriptional regulator [Exilibacterium tricleocarpae]
MNESYSLVDFYCNQNGHGHCQKEIRRGGSFDVTCLLVEMPAYRKSVPAVGDFSVGMGLSTNVPARWNYGEKWINHKLAQPGSTVVTPCNLAVDFDVGGDHLLLLCTCPEVKVVALCESYAEGSYRKLMQLTSFSFIYDHVLRTSMQRIWHVTKEYGFSSDLLIDGLWMTIIGRLLELVNIKPKPSRHKLSSVHIKTIGDYVEENYHQSINTATLAGLVGMSVSRFAKEFRQSTSKTPYQFVLEKRIEKAQLFLCQKSAKLCDVAYRCGFASQTHLSDIFREKLGTTPKQYQKEIAI